MRTQTFQIHWVVLAMAVTAILVSAYKYYVIEHYTFIVEAPCDSANELCFVRDCADDCPPNGLTEYKTYAVPARVFDTCTDNACSNVCADGSCTELLCDPEEDECAAPL